LVLDAVRAVAVVFDVASDIIGTAERHSDVGTALDAVVVKLIFGLNGERRLVVGVGRSNAVARRHRVGSARRRRHNEHAEWRVGNRVAAKRHVELVVAGHRRHVAAGVRAVVVVFHVDFHVAWTVEFAGNRRAAAHHVVVVGVARLHRELTGLACHHAFQAIAVGRRVARHHGTGCHFDVKRRVFDVGAGQRHVERVVACFLWLIASTVRAIAIVFDINVNFLTVDVAFASKTSNDFETAFNALVAKAITRDDFERGRRIGVSCGNAISFGGRFARVWIRWFHRDIEWRIFDVVCFQQHCQWEITSFFRSV